MSAFKERFALDSDIMAEDFVKENEDFIYISDEDNKYEILKKSNFSFEPIMRKPKNTDLLISEMYHIIRYNVVKKEDMENAKNEIIEGQEEGFGSITKLLEENEELRRILSEKYSVKTLFICSSSISIVLLISIFAWFFANFPLIHPMLSIPLLIGSLSFSALSFWKMK
ncbi:MAG: hypothetical protein NTV16_00065 [Actinobacteria bacterium]|nr:hypothetical protein [Actinomycetota bacterium]